MAGTTEKPRSDTVQLVNFRLRDEEYGVDISSVKEITRVSNISHLPEAPAYIQGVTSLRGQIIAVIDLAQQFGLAYQERLPESARIIIAEVNGQTVGMLVDEVPEVIKLPAEDIEATPELIQGDIRRDYVKGVGKIGDRLLILLDLEKVLAPGEVEEVAKVGAPGTEKQMEG